MRARIARSGMDLWAVLAAAVLATLLLIAATQMQAQTFTVIHDFTGGQDGAYPYTGLSADRTGNLYGTTVNGGFNGNDCDAFGGVGGCGTIFKLSRQGSAWLFSPLYQFKGFPSGDGASPYGRVIVGPDGALYGTTGFGGNSGQGCGSSGGIGCGTVFKLTPPATFCRTVICTWNETQLYAFTGPPDGIGPEGEIAFDAAGNLYGATNGGGTLPAGMVFKLTPAHGQWQETAVYNFQANSDGAYPRGGVTLSPAGDLFGTTWAAGTAGNGTVFQLTPSGAGWVVDGIHSFQSEDDGFGNYGGVIIDPSGNLFGATVNGSPNGDAHVFELSPSGGGWTYSLPYTFGMSYGGGPSANLVMDAAGNLYGTTRGLGQTSDPYGSVFKLTRSGSGWIYTNLHEFTGGNDGAAPYSSLIVDANGNIYGTTSQRGAHGFGVVFQIAPS